MGKSLADYTASLMLRPGIVSTITEVEKRKELCESEIKKALNEIITHHDFPFILSSSSFDTVIEQTLYTLKGKKSDCRDIILIEKDGIPLTKMRPIDYSRKYSDIAPPSGASVWVDEGRDGKYPQISIKATPTAIVTLTYSYRKNNITVDSFPEDWDFVLEDVAYGRIFKTWKRNGQKSMKKMVDNYVRRGGEESKIVMDSSWKKRNQLRNNKHGY